MLLNTSAVHGIVVYDETTPTEPASDVTVQIGVVHNYRFVRLGETKTDNTGAFSFSLQDLEHATPAATSFEIRLSGKGEAIPAHGDTRWRSDVDPGPLLICAERAPQCGVPAETLPDGLPGSHKVWGRVRHVDGTPLGNVLVEVRAITFSDEPMLVAVTTNPQGWYGASFQAAGDVVVKVLESQPPATPPVPPRLMGSSRAYFSPTFPLRVDLRIEDAKYRQKTEWSRIGDALNPRIGGTPAANLTLRQVALLSGQTRWDVERISLWVLAHRMQAGDPEAVYGLLRSGFPRAREAFLARPKGTIRPALTRAASRNIIQAGKAEEGFVNAFQAAATTGLRDALNGTRKDTVGEILRATGGLSGAQITGFLDLWLQHEGTEAQFWASFPQGGIDVPTAQEMRRRLTVGALALSYAPLVTAILGVIGGAEAAAMADIPPSGWTTIVNSLTTLPKGLPGATTSEQKVALAGYLAEHVERAFPARTAQKQIVTANTSHPAAPILNQPGFDLATSRVDDFTASSTEKTAAKRVQRLYRVAPGVNRAAAVLALEQSGFTSAASVAKVGRARFVAQMSGTLGVDGAEEVVRKATAMQAITTTFLLQAHPTRSQTNYRFLANKSVDTTQIPDWQTLFGNAGGCACGHCRSVYSPAAYLVDLFQWLEARSVPGGGTLYDALIARRPDLAEIELSCENAERALPYIDLVMEALESAVQNAGGIGTDAAHDSEVETADMLAAPQYRNDDAYVSLAADQKSLTLPFHRALEESRAFLIHLGVPRATLLRAFKGVGPSGAAVGDAEIAIEGLGLFEARLATITGDGAEDIFWPVDQMADLEAVPTFLKAAACSWPELQDLVHTRLAGRSFSGGTWSQRLSFSSTDPCDIATYTLQGGTANGDAGWKAMRRFVRLWLAVGGEALALDRALVSLGVTDLAGSAWVEPLANLRRLAELTGRPMDALAATQATTLDTFEDRTSKESPSPSVYDRVYRAPSVMVVGDPSYAAFLLDSTRTELVNPNLPNPRPLLSDYAATIAAALGRTQAELDELMLEFPALPANPPALTLANLTTLYAWSEMARAAGLTPADLRALVAMTGLAPRTSLADLLALVELGREILALGWSVDELYYLTHHERADRVGLSDSVAQRILGRVREAVRTEMTAVGDGTTEASVREVALRVLAQELSVEPDVIGNLRGVSFTGIGLDVGTAFTLVEEASFAASVSVALPQGTRCVLTGGVAGVLVDDATGAASTVHCLPGAGWTGTGDGDATFPDFTVGRVRSVVLPAGTEVETSSGIITVPATPPMQVDLVEDALVTQGFSGVSLSYGSEPPAPDLLQRFLRSGFLAGDGAGYEDITDAGEYAQDFLVLRVLHKVVMVLNHLQMDDAERTFWLSTNTWGLMGAEELKGEASEAPVVWAGLLNLLRLFALRARLPGTVPSFVELLGSAGNATDFAAALAARTAWSVDDIVVVAGLSGSAPGTVDGLRALVARMEIVRRVGASASVVAGWVCAPGSVEPLQSASVVEAARGRATAESWSGIARGVRDPLRKAQRDALVAYLMGVAIEAGDTAIRTVEDLYERYLIDVSMNPELLTSRIVQACATVQLFVHRLLLGLEVDGSGAALFEANAEDREQWEWMRAYRMWEAARKVFLYPENWIEPELRSDKTPFFQTLEQELAQGDTTLERVEQALLDYLDRLGEISHLKVLAYAHEQEAPTGGDEIDRLHVFASTRSTPPTYWYRRYEAARWTAWEKVECGLDGEHLVPVVYERRLLLFWGTLSEGASGEETVTELSLSWSEYRDGKWSGKRISERVQFDVPSASDLILLRDDGEGAGIVIKAVDKSHMFTNTHAYSGAKFILDLCRMELSVSLIDVTVARLGVAGGAWTREGFIIGTPYTINHLHVHQAQIGEDGAPLDDSRYAVVPLLDSLSYAYLVAPAVLDDFVSQSPFFVQDTSHTWFVLPGTPQPVEVTGDSGTPLIGSSSFRRGTYVPLDNAPSPTDPGMIRSWSSYLASSDYLSDGEAERALSLADQMFVASVEPSSFDLVSGSYQFRAFYHPHVCTFTEAVRRKGVFALLDPDPDGPEANLSTGNLRRQQLTGSFDFAAELAPHPFYVAQPYPVEDVDFSGSGAYSIYNWEIFYHLPMYVAERLMDAGRHDAAMKVFHAVFDPRVPASDVPAGFEASARFWKVAPLMAPASAPVTDWVAFTGATDPAVAEAFMRQVDAWRSDPFNPHLLAWLRPDAYGKATVMRYVENLIAWGDQLFTRDTLESLNEATQLYVFARQILGDRPVLVQSTDAPVHHTYTSLKASGAMDAFGNVTLENACTVEVSSTGTGSAGTALLTSTGLTAYFCIPHNAKLWSLWDLVDDRLFKLRNGMNISGVARTLPLFQPPIDPAMLVRAAAAGMDLGMALDALSVSLPNHRFAVMHGRASALAGSVRALGQALLAAIEKKDGEELARLRQEQEQSLLRAVSEIRDRQIKEAEAQVEIVKSSKELISNRLTYYQNLTNTHLINKEILAINNTLTADALQAISGGYAALSSVLGMFPDTTIGLGAGVETGGAQASRVLGAYGQIYGLLSSQHRSRASYLQTMAGYDRRKQEWKQQVAQATKELEQVEKQIEAAKLRVEIAKKERSNHDLQVSHSAQVADFLSRKFANAELYQWMIGQISALYFQQFQLALATAKKAQACFNHELGRSDTFLQPSYWDSLRKGLLAGERLSADLERMDVAYLERDVREYELTRHISLMLLDPMAVERLKTEGVCYFSLPEALFDLDCPSHYFRRIQSLALSLSCISGPQGTVNAKLTLHRSALRRTASVSGDAEEESSAGYPAIVTSAALNDPGVFSADPRDPRYLPFERKGVISTWKLEFTATTVRQFDWASLEDVTLHLRYTAREGGAGRTPALSALDIGLPQVGMAPVTGGFVRVISALRDAPDVLLAAQLAEDDTLTLPLSTQFDPPMRENTLPPTPLSLSAILAIPRFTPTSTPDSLTQINGGNMVHFGTAFRYVSLSSSTDFSSGFVLTLTGTDYTALTDLLLVLVYA